MRKCLSKTKKGKLWAASGNRDGSLIRSEGFWPHNMSPLKFYYYYPYYNLGVQPVCGASRKKVAVEFGSMP